ASPSLLFQDRSDSGSEFHDLPQCVARRHLRRHSTSYRNLVQHPPKLVSKLERDESLNVEPELVVECIGNGIVETQIGHPPRPLFDEAGILRLDGVYDAVVQIAAEREAGIPDLVVFT